MAEIIQVYASTESRRNADKIASKLLDERVASCVQVIGPIDSRYWWKGKIEHAREWLCVVKARTKDYRTIEASIKKVHPYEIPEILAVPVLRGNPDYLRWIRRETTRKL